MKQNIIFIFQQGGCFLFKVWEALLIGMIGAFLTCSLMPILDKLSIDDPVGAAATHGSYFFLGYFLVFRFF